MPGVFRHDHPVPFLDDGRCQRVRLGEIDIVSSKPAEDESVTEAEEATQLEGLAKITAEHASSAASDAVPGDVTKVELDNENGSVVYSVEITDTAGAEVDVKVDAGNGTILDQQADNDEADEADEADDDAVQHENEHEGENDADEGHED